MLGCLLAKNGFIRFAGAAVDQGALATQGGVLLFESRVRCRPHQLGLPERCAFDAAAVPVAAPGRAGTRIHCTHGSPTHGLVARHVLSHAGTRVRWPHGKRPGYVVRSSAVAVCSKIVARYLEAAPQRHGAASPIRKVLCAAPRCSDRNDVRPPGALRTAAARRAATAAHARISAGSKARRMRARGG